MDHLWILLTVAAALMQSVRTAAQKNLSLRLSNLATTYVRSLFGLPVLIVYLAIVLIADGGGLPTLTPRYLLFVLVGAITQVTATVLLVYMFQLRNYIIGTMLTRIDLVTTAVFGTLLFSEQMTAGGMTALAVVIAGAILLSAGRLGTSLAAGSGSRSTSELLQQPTLYVALLCAVFFSFSFLSFREALLVMGSEHFVWRAAWTVVIAVAMQVVLVGLWLHLRHPGAIAGIWPEWRLAGFIGLTSALGSIFWFTAFALQNASYVRAVGQIEVVFTLLISRLYFAERITRLELAGIAVTVAGVAMFRFQ